MTRSVTQSSASGGNSITPLDPVLQFDSRSANTTYTTSAALPAVTTLDLEAIGDLPESPEEEKAELEKEAKDEFYVEWEEGDGENPLNWTKGRRWYVTLLAASCVCFFYCFLSSILGHI